MIKFKKYRVKKEHIYPKRVNTSLEIHDVYNQGYTFYQGNWDDYYMVSVKEYKFKPSLLESLMVKVELV